MAGALAGKVVAVLGGDMRMLEHIRGGLANGAEVRHHGCVPEAAAMQEARACATVEEALRGAIIVSCPIPGVGVDASLYAPHAPAPIKLTAEKLRLAAPGAVVFSGPMPHEMEAWAKEAGVKALDYSEDDPLSILHAIPTAEGAIRVAVEHTAETICGMKTLCIGYGRVGVSVAAAFQAMNARVTVAARNPVQLARAESLGLDTVHTDRLAEVVGDYDLVVSSPTAKLVTAEVLAAVKPDALVIDLRSPPGSVDHDAGKALGRRIVWARAQAGTAPRTAGRNEWRVVTRIFAEVSSG
jgi:dipicolinate synthase subunit A